MRTKSEIQAAIEQLEDDIKGIDKTIRLIEIQRNTPKDGIYPNVYPRLNELYNHKREILEKIRILKWMLGETF